jgi:hypothetical protein
MTNITQLIADGVIAGYLHDLSRRRPQASPTTQEPAARESGSVSSSTRDDHPKSVAPIPRPVYGL